MLSILRKLTLHCLSWADWIDLHVLCLLSITPWPFWKMRLRRSEQTQRVERSTEDGQESFQIKAGPCTSIRIMTVTQTTFSLWKRLVSSKPDSCHIKSLIFVFYFFISVERVLRSASVVMAFMSVVAWHTHTNRKTHRHYALKYVSLLLHTHWNTNVLYAH